jgi:hypothetical protein
MVDLNSIPKQIKNGGGSAFFKVEWISAFFAAQAPALSEEQFDSLFEDFFMFNQYLNRLDDYSRIEDVPYWEYSNALYWIDNHVLGGADFSIKYGNVKRFFDHLDRFYDFLIAAGHMTGKEQVVKARREILKGKKAVLIEDIPYTGNEFYTALVRAGKTTTFRIYDKWLLMLLDSTGYNWKKLQAAARLAGPEKLALCNELKDKWTFLGFTDIHQLVFEELYETDFYRALDWFCEKNHEIRGMFNLPG